MKLIQLIIVFMSLLMSLKGFSFAESRWPADYFSPGVNGMIEAGGFYYKVTDKSIDKSFNEDNNSPLFFGELSWTSQNYLSLFTSAESLGEEKIFKTGIVKTGFDNEMKLCFQYKKEKVLEDPHSNDHIFSLTCQESFKTTASYDGIASTNAGSWYSCSVLKVHNDLPAETNPELARNGLIHTAGIGYCFKIGNWHLEPSVEISCAKTKGKSGEYYGYGAGVDLKHLGTRSILDLSLAVETDIYHSIHPVYKVRLRDKLAKVKFSYTILDLFNTRNLYATCGSEFYILTTTKDYYERKTVTCFVMGGIRFN